jgi:hypothetical protein
MKEERRYEREEWKEERGHGNHRGHD